MSKSNSLVNEFPELRDQIHNLKVSDAHFGRLFSEYDEIEHEIHRIESENEASSDERLEELKKKRLSLKDQLFGMLQKAA